MDDTGEIPSFWISFLLGKSLFNFRRKAAILFLFGTKKTLERSYSASHPAQHCIQSQSWSSRLNIFSRFVGFLAHKLNSLGTFSLFLKVARRVTKWPQHWGQNRGMWAILWVKSMKLSSNLIGSRIGNSAIFSHMLMFIWMTFFCGSFPQKYINPVSVGVFLHQEIQEDATAYGGIWARWGKQPPL